ncbi:hypothetical protein CYMTET_8931, partial [Cymbomonas tetramitiformis]
DHEGWTSFHIAAAIEHRLEWLHTSFAPSPQWMDSAGRTPMHLAVMLGLRHAVFTLQLLGCDIQAKDAFGLTPLHLAAWIDDVQMIGELHRLGANVEATCYVYRTPLAYATANKSTSAFMRLLDMGAEYDRKDLLGRSMMHTAAWYGYTDGVHMLSGLGLDVNSRDGAGLTPMHLAARRGSTDTIEALEDRQALLGLLDSKNKTPFILAAEFNQPAAVQLLYEKGVDPTDMDKYQYDAYALCSDPHLKQQIRKMVNEFTLLQERPHLRPVTWPKRIKANKRAGEMFLQMALIRRQREIAAMRALAVKGSKGRKKKKTPLTDEAMAPPPLLPPESLSVVSRLASSSTSQLEIPDTSLEKIASPQLKSPEKSPEKIASPQLKSPDKNPEKIALPSPDISPEKIASPQLKSPEKIALPSPDTSPEKTASPNSTRADGITWTKASVANASFKAGEMIESLRGITAVIPPQLKAILTKALPDMDIKTVNLDTYGSLMGLALGKIISIEVVCNIIIMATEEVLGDVTRETCRQKVDLLSMRKRTTTASVAKSRTMSRAMKDKKLSRYTSVHRRCSPGAEVPSNKPSRLDPFCQTRQPVVSTRSSSEGPVSMSHRTLHSTLPSLPDRKVSDRNAFHLPSSASSFL